MGVRTFATHRRPKKMNLQRLTHSALLFSLLTVSLYAHPFVLVVSPDDLDKSASSSPDDSSSNPNRQDSAAEWDGFGYSDSHSSDSELGHGSWRPILEPGSSAAEPISEADALYFSGLSKMVNAVSSGYASLANEAASELEAAGEVGHPHARSVLGFLHGVGLMRERNKAKAFMYHHFAAEDGNTESKMALAYAYFNQEVRSLQKFWP